MSTTDGERAAEPQRNVAVEYFYRFGSELELLFFVEVLYEFLFTAMAKCCLEEAIEKVADVFMEYSNSDLMMNKAEVMKMMEKEIQNPEIKVRNTFCYSYFCFLLFHH